MELPQCACGDSPLEGGRLKASLLENRLPRPGEVARKCQKGNGRHRVAMTEGVRLVENECRSKRAGGKESI